METKIFFQVKVILVMISVTFCIPVALRSPLWDKKGMSQWRELRLHSEEDNSHDREVKDGALITKALRYPDDEVEHIVFTAERDAFPNADKSTRSQSRAPESGLERFYKHPSPTRKTDGEIIVFPDEKPASEEANDKIANDKQNADVFKLSPRSDGMVSPTPISEAEIFERHEEEYEPPLERLDKQIVRQVLSSMSSDQVTETPETDSTTIEHRSENGGVAISEHSLYTGPKLKLNENGDSGCPNGEKRTRNGPCQKHSRRLMQSG